MMEVMDRRLHEAVALWLKLSHDDFQDRTRTAEAPASIYRASVRCMPSVGRHFQSPSLLLIYSTVAPKKFLTIPLGKVKPAGWLMDQLLVQTNGLAGHLHEFYNYVSQTDWMGGTSYYSNLEEAGSYWFNAMVPNGVLANNAAINARTSQFLNYVLSHQDSTGWLGPEVNTNKPRYLWG
ncbi:hypothetical protein H0H93_015847, partial [Arthromyces matolae]